MPLPASFMKDIQQASSIRFNNLGYELKAAGRDLIVLSLGEAFFDIPLYGFDDLPFPDIYHYSHSRGILALRQKIAGYFKTQYGVSFSPDRNIIITAGSKLAIYMSLLAILNPGEEVIIFEPYWVSYPEQVKLCRGRPVTLPVGSRVEDVINYITPQTKAIILNNPHNPSGRVYSFQETEYLANIAKEHDLYILSDEVYSDFVPEREQFTSMGVFGFENIIVCNSISKNYGISGWRLGYVIGNYILMDEILKVNQHVLTCPATILQYYIEKHFYDIVKITKPQIQKVLAQRERAVSFMDKLGIEHLPGSAAWYIFASIKPSSLGSEEFCRRLLYEYDTLIVPGIGYGESCDSFIRVCVGTETTDRIEQGIKNIQDLIDKS